MLHRWPNDVAILHRYTIALIKARHRLLTRFNAATEHDVRGEVWGMEKSSKLEATRGPVALDQVWFTQTAASNLPSASSL
jgi:hypothetical protein